MPAPSLTWRRERASCSCTPRRSATWSAVLREGYTLVPLDLYWKEGRVKVTLGLGRGRKAHDKRAILAEKTATLEALEAVRARRDGRA